MTTLGLRVDVDTFRGTREGVPRLLEVLATHQIKASFFFSVGPDNMGRHLWRVLQPAFLAKMLRSRAVSLYGKNILLAGTCWPGRPIAKTLGAVIRAADEAGHEVGLHAWDHYRWQTHSARMSAVELRKEIQVGVDALSELLGHEPVCSAAAGWICNERALRAKESFGFTYNSDCRGDSIFRPRIDGHQCVPQIPTTLPTYDELIGRQGVSWHNYNNRLLQHIRKDDLNVLTAHAEVEGIACTLMFEEFLFACRERGIRVAPLSSLLREQPVIPSEPIAQGPIAGRPGRVCWQRSTLLRYGRWTDQALQI